MDPMGIQWAKWQIHPSKAAARASTSTPRCWRNWAVFGRGERARKGHGGIGGNPWEDFGTLGKSQRYLEDSVHETIFLVVPTKKIQRKKHHKIGT